MTLNSACKPDSNIAELTSLGRPFYSWSWQTVEQKRIVIGGISFPGKQKNENAVWEKEKNLFVIKVWPTHRNQSEKSIPVSWFPLRNFKSEIEPAAHQKMEYIKNIL